MAKGSPTADETANFGVNAAPAKASGPNIMAGASMTKAPNDAAAKSGYWAPNSNLPAGVTAQWVPPAAVAPPTIDPVPGVTRNDLVMQILTGKRPAAGTPYGPNAENTAMDKWNARLTRGSRGGGASQGDRQGATTSGRDSWGGSSGGRGGGYW